VPQVKLKEHLINVADTHPEFWKKAASGRWEATTFSVYEACVDADTLCLDIGAWIGPTVLFAAGRAKSVIAFEPDPVAWKTLRENVALNPSLAAKIVLHPKAIWSEAGKRRMKSQGQPGDSMSSLLESDAKTTETWDVDCISAAELEGFLAGHEKVFVKIDIEGGEYELIPHLGRILSHPNIDVLVSFHPRFAIASRWRYPASRRMSRRVFRCFQGFHVTKVGRRRFGRPWELILFKKTGLWVLSARDSYLFTRSPRNLGARAVRL
jgi:FkbM family methyltransferase